MKDTECIRFLQLALPRLGLRWPGFRRVRGQVCKRIDRRMHALGLADPDAYITYLDTHPDEWQALDGLCTISISRFYRDRSVFDCVGERLLPAVAARASRDEATVRCWSAGCASGEEPYTLSLIWNECVGPRFSKTPFAVLATDIDKTLLDRARAACYPWSSVSALPRAWIEKAFVRRGDEYCLRDRWKACVEFCEQDLRKEQPAGPFDLVLCRNVAFTYFDQPLQCRIAERLAQQVRVDGFLVVGRHETLPLTASFVSYLPGLGVYRRG